VSDAILAKIRAAADPRAVVELYGSSVYAPAHASDVDALVSDDDPARLAAALGFELLPTQPPRLHGTLDGTPVDITIANGDGEVAQRMRLGPRDAAAIAAHLRTHGRDDVFQAAWPHVRRFVRARALGHNGLGWFGSFGWALLLAAPLATDPELRAAAAGAAVPAWLRWLSRLALHTRVELDGTRAGDPAPLFLAAPSPPAREVSHLSKRAAGWLVTEARTAATAIGDATTDAGALARIPDIADSPPPGATLVISGDDERVRGRYDGTARGLLRELEATCAARSWGRFDLPEGGGWQHRITVPAARLASCRTLVEDWLALNRLDAVVE
jgi:hypothetical protein